MPRLSTPLFGIATALILLGSVAMAQQQGFDSWDKNKDGFVTKAEFPASLPKRFFDLADADKDGKISRAEDVAFRKRLQQRRQNLPQGTEVKRNIVYAKVGDRELHLDLYQPPATKQKSALPLVIWVHGGAWKAGSKDRTQAVALLRHGYAVASVEYRLSGEAIFPAAINDCKAAVSFLRKNAKQYKLDAQRFGAWGSSAGGHLVSMLGTTGDTKEFQAHPVTRDASSEVQAVCNWFGPSDFLKMNDFPSVIDHDAPNSPESEFIGGPIQENKEKVAKANPITYVSEKDPPFLHMHGDADRLVPFNQSELLHDALKKQGVTTTLYKVVKGNHGLRGGKETPQELFKMVHEFFDKHLKPAPEKKS